MHAGNGETWAGPAGRHDLQSWDHTLRREQLPRPRIHTNPLPRTQPHPRTGGLTNDRPDLRGQALLLQVAAVRVIPKSAATTASRPATSPTPQAPCRPSRWSTSASPREWPPTTTTGLRVLLRRRKRPSELHPEHRRDLGQHDGPHPHRSTCDHSGHQKGVSWHLRWCRVPPAERPTGAGHARPLWPRSETTPSPLAGSDMCCASGSSRAIPGAPAHDKRMLRSGGR
jgi:hypothetical protein